MQASEIFHQTLPLKNKSKGVGGLACIVYASICHRLVCESSCDDHCYPKIIIRGFEHISYMSDIFQKVANQLTLDDIFTLNEFEPTLEDAEDLISFQTSQHFASLTCQFLKSFCSRNQITARPKLVLPPTSRCCDALADHQTVYEDRESSKERSWARLVAVAEEVQKVSLATLKLAPYRHTNESLVLLSRQAFGLSSAVVACDQLATRSSSDPVKTVDLGKTDGACLSLNTSFSGLIFGGLKAGEETHVNVLKNLINFIESESQTTKPIIPCPFELVKYSLNHFENNASFEIDYPAWTLNRLLAEMAANPDEQPIVIRGFCQDPPTPEYIWSLLGRSGNRYVPVETQGGDYSKSDWELKVVKFEDFLTNLSTLDQPDTKQPYLAQYPLHLQLESLKEIVAPFNTASLIISLLSDRHPVIETDEHEPCSLKDAIELGAESLKDPGLLQNVWIGPAGTVTPYHQDPYSNLFVQICGTKYFQFQPPSAAMLPNTKVSISILIFV